MQIDINFDSDALQVFNCNLQRFYRSILKSDIETFAVRFSGSARRKGNEPGGKAFYRLERYNGRKGKGWVAHIPSSGVAKKTHTVIFYLEVNHV